MIEIKHLVPSDADAMWHLRLEALQQAPLAFGEHHGEHARMSIEAVAERLAVAETFVYGAFDGNALIGMAGFYRNRQRNRRHKGNVWGVYVQPAYRGQGISRRLISAIIGEAKRIEGLEEILLSVSQPEARELYISMGFWPYGKQQRALIVDGVAVDEELMSLTL